jgi:NAD dependent epimerase/dehydratase family enzyme
METISITGSSCFIGKHLVRVLTKQNYNLNLLSRNNLSTSTDKKNYINFDLNKKYKKVVEKESSVSQYPIYYRCNNFVCFKLFI